MKRRIYDMEIYTIGFTKKSAKDFFELIGINKIQILIDIRLNNQSQLAGFTKGRDLEYFLKNLCNCNYEHLPMLAPTKQLLDNYKHNKIKWSEYETIFNGIIKERKIDEIFSAKFAYYNKVCLLCSESEPDNCHRRLVAEYLKDKLSFNIEIKHI